MLSHPIKLDSQGSALLVEPLALCLLLYKLCLALLECRFASLVSLLVKCLGGLALFELGLRAGKFALECLYRLRLLTHFYLAADELLELFLGASAIELPQLFVCVGELLLTLLKRFLQDFVISQSLGQLGNLLVLVLQDFEDFGILALLRGPLMLHCLCQKFLKLGLPLSQ